MKAFRVPILLFLLYFIFGIFTIKHYGINWDEPAHFMRGQAFLRYLIEGKKDYAGLPEIDKKSYTLDWGYEFKDTQTGKITRRSIYQHWDRELAFYTQDIEKRGSHPAFSDVMGALSNYIFFIRLGIAPDVFSYNYYIVLVAAILVAALYIWVRKYFGAFSGFIASVSLALFPVFWAESHNNIKDIPEAVFYSLAMLIFYEAIQTKKREFVWMFAIISACAFATKFNFLFIVPTIFLWGLLRWLILYKKSVINLGFFWKRHRGFVLSFLVVPFAMFALWVVTFPATWFAPKLLLASFTYYKTVGVSTVKHVNLYPIYYLLFTTVPIVLLYALGGMISFFALVSKKQKDVLLFVAVWFLVPIVRVMVPHTTIYGGVRQIMEYIPALAILSGIGAGQIVRWVQEFVAKRFTAVHREKTTHIVRMLSYSFISLTFLPIVFTVISIHPNEGAYFNWFIGGLRGAKEKNIPDWGQTLGNPHRQGILWINEHAEPNAKLSLAFEYWANLPHIWVRNDIEYDSLVKSGPLRQGEYIMSVVNKSDFLDWYRFRVIDAYLNPVYQVEVDTVPLLKVWKNDNDHIKPQLKNIVEEKILPVSLFRQWPSLTLTLPSPRKLLRIEFINEGEELCEDMHEVNDYVGNFQLYADEKMSHARALRASAYNFNEKVNYPKPFFFFAGDTAQIIVFNVAVDNLCYSTIKGAYVYVIKE